MDIEILTKPVNDLDEYAKLQEELIADLAAQVEAEGLTLKSTQPNSFRFGAVISDWSEGRWLHVTIDNVQENPFWSQNVKLRRMSSERDWKGEEFHLCAWNEIGVQAKKYLSPEFDEEVL